MGRGGKRPGAGRPVGVLKTEKERLNALIAKRVGEKADELLDAKMDLALGHKRDGERPDGQAIQYLINRVVGKPVEMQEHSGELSLTYISQIRAPGSKLQPRDATNTEL